MAAEGFWLFKSTSTFALEWHFYSFGGGKEENQENKKKNFPFWPTMSFLLLLSCDEEESIYHYYFLYCCSRSRYKREKKTREIKVHPDHGRDRHRQDIFLCSHP